MFANHKGNWSRSTRDYETPPCFWGSENKGGFHSRVSTDDQRSLLHVGPILELVLRDSGKTSFDPESGEKIFPHQFPHDFHAFPPLKVCGIVSYDDLLLPMHRWFAQVLVFASGEHFQCRNFPELCYTAMYCTLPYTNRKMRHEILL